MTTTCSIRIAFAMSFFALFVWGCQQATKTTTVFINANIYATAWDSTTATAMVVEEGKIVEVGKGEDLIKKYPHAEQVNLKGQYVYPAFYDAHAHFYGLGASLFSVDLVGTKSWEEVVERCQQFQKNNQLPFLIGRGWDQNNWERKDFPTNEALNKFFPDIPVFLVRIDGHAAVANDYLLHQARIDKNQTIEGGDFLRQNNTLTGVLIDNAAGYVEKHLPAPSLAMKIKYLQAAEKKCFSYGLTSVADAGLSPDIIDLIDSLQQADALHIRLYAMLEANDENINTYTKRPIKKTDKLHVSSFKMYADGALGSRGAYLSADYTDKKNQRGLLLTSEKKMEEIVQKISQSAYQLNTHCIGDEANHIVLALYAKYLPQQNDRRWRIEHAQIVHPQDMEYFRTYNIIPSVQPTHATSDGNWAEQRLGKTRITYAYPLHNFLTYTPHLALGTDFPVEDVNPFYTFYAATTRRHPLVSDDKGFLVQEAISRPQTLAGMTIEPAYAAFEEKEKGTLEQGKWADFIVLEEDLMSTDLTFIKDAKVKATYLSGKKVY